MDGLKRWMTKACLGTFLEVSFKKLMDIQDSPSFSIGDAINSADEADVVIHSSKQNAGLY